MKAKASFALNEAIEVALNRVQRRFDKSGIGVTFTDAMKEIVENLIWEEVYERFAFEEGE
jgi:hypothetical protein